MSWSMSAGLATHIAEGGWRLVWCWRIDRPDGTRHAWTRHNRPLTIDLGDGVGGVTYSPSGLSKDKTPTESLTGGEIARTTVKGLTTLSATDGIPLDDLKARKLDGAKIIAFRADYANPGNGGKGEFAGRIKTADWRGKKWEIECESLLAVFDQPITRAITPECPLDFMGAKCGVASSATTWAVTTAYTQRAVQDARIGSVVEPTTPNGWWYEATTGGTSGGSEPTWPTTEGGTVTDETVTWRATRQRRWSGVATSASGVTIVATGISVSSGFFAPRGRLTWTSGANNGLTAQVIADDGAGTLTLLEAPRLAVANGDTFTIDMSCDRTKTGGCAFNRNVRAFRGFSGVPGRRVRNQTGTS